jgi:DNA replication and repair protein RecF
MRALGEGDDIAFAYVADWGGGELGLDDLGSVEDRLREGLATLRRRELERQMTLVGPHRDELRMRLSGLEARTQASQGEQRSLALALRLAGHGVVTELTDSVPVLLLDDVFSELDARRSAVLVGLLPPGQTLLTTATAVPSGVHPTAELLVQDAKVGIA